MHGWCFRNVHSLFHYKKNVFTEFHASTDRSDIAREVGRILHESNLAGSEQ